MWIPTKKQAVRIYLMEIAGGVFDQFDEIIHEEYRSSERVEAGGKETLRNSLSNWQQVFEEKFEILDLMEHENMVNALVSVKTKQKMAWFNLLPKNNIATYIFVAMFYFKDNKIVNIDIFEDIKEFLLKLGHEEEIPVCIKRWKTGFQDIY